MGIVIFFFVVIAGGVALMVCAAKENERKTSEARISYATALARLKESPTDPNLRSNALRLGREYSNLTRDGKGVAVFDEVAISNDLNAACAASAVRPSSEPRSDVVEKLRALNQLKAAALVNDVEFASMRAAILSEVVSA